MKMILMATTNIVYAEWFMNSLRKIGFLGEKQLMEAESSRETTNNAR